MIPSTTTCTCVPIQSPVYVRHVRYFDNIVYRDIFSNVVYRDIFSNIAIQCFPISYHNNCHRYCKRV